MKPQWALNSAIFIRTTESEKASENEEQYKEILRILFELFKKYEIIINQKKCIFGVEVVPFHGYLVNTDGITPLPDKVEAICKLERPETAA